MSAITKLKDTCSKAAQYIPTATSIFDDSITLNPPQIAVLLFVDEYPEGLQSRQRLAKFMFLLDHEHDHGTFYEYKKYDYGPFPKVFRADLGSLQYNDLLEVHKEHTAGGRTRRTYHTTEFASESLTTLKTEREPVNELADDIHTIYNTHKDTDLIALFQHVRELAPEYWENNVYYSVTSPVTPSK